MPRWPIGLLPWDCSPLGLVKLADATFGPGLKVLAVAANALDDAVAASRRSQSICACRVQPSCSMRLVPKALPNWVEPAKID